LQQREFPKLKQPMLDAITKVTGQEACEWICENAILESPQTLLLDTLTRFTVLNQPDSSFSGIVNIHRVNDIRRINMFFEAVNGKLNPGGIFVGCGETYWLRKQKILKRYPPVINYLVYIPDFIYHRLMPKLTITNKLYFLLSKGKNRVISRTEILGRLVSCGFEILAEKPIGNLLWFQARKVRQPYFDNDPSYGLLIRLRRIGKGGQEFHVFKFRTMHPYSEYLQEYLYQNHQLAEGGKFGTDFRVTTIGRIFRKYWLDELPMFINLATGDIKLVGVRPISAHYFSLYSEAMQKERIRHKPGLIPPYYAQFPMPKTLEEIEQNELTYLRLYEKHPFRTDMIYLYRAVCNILFRKARSK
jgi:lipopolysaccharide/colanic/teichoic acid biosynthesis glycosyltransferase